MKAVERRRRRVLAVERVGVLRSRRGILVKRELSLCFCFFLHNIGNGNWKLKKRSFQKSNELRQKSPDKLSELESLAMVSWYLFLLLTFWWDGGTWAGLRYFGLIGLTLTFWAGLNQTLSSLSLILSGLIKLSYNILSFVATNRIKVVTPKW